MQEFLRAHWLNRGKEINAIGQNKWEFEVDDRFHGIYACSCIDKTTKAN